MKKLLTALSLTVCAFAAMAQASAPAAQPREKGVCGKEADTKGLKGAERKKFVTECHNARKEQVKAERKAKHESCAAEIKSKGLKGPEARQAMKTCMAK